ncbi:MAG: PSK operon transcription factor [Alphaproteobacteria bacterium]|nr:PSK operon transcription factor [Alphaproteobacteria bacterium]
MALNILDPEIDRLARELARLTGTSATEAIRQALSEKIATLQKPKKASLEELMRIAEAVDRLPILDPRDPDEMLCDEFGIPK